MGRLAYHIDRPLMLTTAHWLCCWGKIHQHCPSGDLTNVTDQTLELWAQWDGTPLTFADGFRTQFCDLSGSTVWPVTVEAPAKPAKKEPKQRKHTHIDGEEWKAVVGLWERNFKGQPLGAALKSMHKLWKDDGTLVAPLSMLEDGIMIAADFNEGRFYSPSDLAKTFWGYWADRVEDFRSNGMNWTLLMARESYRRERGIQ